MIDSETLVESVFGVAKEPPSLSPILAHALAAHRAGLCVYPPRQDGSKYPATDSWKLYQTQRTSEEDLRRLYADPCRTGIGYFTGPSSGNLEMFELENEDTWNEYQTLIADNGLEDLWHRVTSGYLERAPRGGYHILWRTDDVEGNKSLAKRPKRPDEIDPKHPKALTKVLIETRGRGGYTVAAPSFGAVHPSGKPYVMVHGGVDSIATVSAEERSILFSIARMMDQMPEPPQVNRDPTPRKEGEERPGDRFNRETSWDVLTQHYGFTYVSRRGKEWSVRRPGKDHGTSANINHNGNDRIKVFSSSTPVPTEGTHSKFEFYAWMEHNGDFPAAAKALGTEYRERDKEQSSVASGMHDSITPRPSESPPSEGKVDATHPSPGGMVKGVNKQRVRSKRMSDVQSKPVDWLWPKMLARGKFHLFAGQPGDGKSTITAALAAIGSQGGAWPDGTSSPKFRTYFILGEDALDDTLRPRLDLHGADVEEIFALETVLDEKGEDKFFNVAKHHLALEAEVVEQRVDLVIIDPLSSVMVGADRNQEGDSRDMLTPLVKLAERQNVAIIGIAHTGKPSGIKRTAQQQILGSTGLVALSRIVWQTAESEDGERFFGTTKNNLSPFAPALRWDRPEDQPIRWLGASDRSIEAIINKNRVQYMDVDDGAPEKPTVRQGEVAEAFLREALSGGMKLALDMEQGAKALGISPSTLDRAKKKLGVRSDKLIPRDPRWYWTLEPGTPQVAKSDPDFLESKGVIPVHINVTPLTPLAHLPKATEEEAEQGCQGCQLSVYGDDTLAQDGGARLLPQFPRPLSPETFLPSELAALSLEGVA